MKLNKIVLAVSLAFGVTAFAQADDGHGSVTFTGSIIDAPCTIDPDTIDQTVEMGQVSNVALAANKNTGASAPKNFEIRLEQCDISTKKSVTATFTGIKGGTTGLLGLTGTARGASLAMADSGGRLIELGKATVVQELLTSNNTLEFSAYLQGDGASTAIVPGSFKGVTNFTLAYQ
ncbi:TPA: fimbrial protein [Serratia fonticola]|uniref:fimbrial protein n=1 Tax=Serratia fonticola TaxID=47917 RepID=UPI0021788F26|nr:fimbrial protein [Serratia fonticola]CAI1542634.1 Fimbria A protein precursor [Serratia fonticola]CAI1730749.1 Fimbria A protein precursor [Serratia fonticola]CAI1996201.1 Fimbria A protein precursor [Serratia fonticola]CAI2001969.1 Fimbria A protein precursor [Serratia fonticola]